MGLFTVYTCPHCGKVIERSDAITCPYCGGEIEKSHKYQLRDIMEFLQDSFWAVASFLVGIVLTFAMTSVLSKDGFSMQSLGLLALGLAFMIGGFFWSMSQIKKFFKK